MSNLLNSVGNVSRTANDGVTLASSNSANVDLFFLAGASRGKDISRTFFKAYAENSDVALRILLWMRDVRGGAGERKQFRDLLLALVNSTETFNSSIPAIMKKISEVGRWDDLLIFAYTKYEDAAFRLICNALGEENGLCAKWMPRPKSSKVALRLAKWMDLTPKAYRKLIVELSNTVETSMCSNAWKAIDYGKIPSVAAARYQAAFNKHDEFGYKEYREGLESGATTVNAGAVYPYDIYKSLMNVSLNTSCNEVAEAQWKGLPNYIEGSTERLMPVIDVSGSMGQLVFGSKSMSCMNVAVSLGLYISERMEGKFKNEYITFSERPQIGSVKGITNLRDKFAKIYSSDWGYNTDIEAVFKVVLTAAKRNNLSQEDMPTKIVILSDMEFDRCSHSSRTMFEQMTADYAASGYVRPDIIFWNLSGREGNSPVSMLESGTAMVSGFSPSIMKSILGNSDMLTPEGVMLETVMVERYAIA